MARRLLPAFVPKGPDPRQNAAPVSELPRLVREGAARFHAREFWHAHESWEEAWHSLRAAGETEPAEFLHGMILCAAALENAKRGKEHGFKRQLAEALYLMRTHFDGAGRVGVTDAARFLDGMALLYVDACRRVDWTHWNASGWRAPELAIL